jgi:hypothetical protein
MTDEELEALMGKFKKALRADCREILALATRSNSEFGTLMEKILREGIISGSRLGNLFHPKISPNGADFDIFVNYSITTKSELKKLAEKYATGFEEITFAEDNYKFITDSDSSFKFILGKLSKVQVNVTFVKGLDPVKLVSNFDFENSNWYYGFDEDVIHVTDACLVLLQNGELDFTDKRRKMYQEQILKYPPRGPDDVMDQETMSLVAITIKRLQKYTVDKKYVISLKMRGTIEQLNDRLGTVWNL